MRKHRIFLDQALELGSSVSLDTTLSHYLRKVLRLKSGDKVQVFNNSGYEYLANLEFRQKTVILNIIDRSEQQETTRLKLTLAQVLCKGHKFELALQKATELGVDKIVPIYSERSLIKETIKSASKLEHWQNVIISASAQCQRNIVPILDCPMQLSDFLTTANDPDKLVLSPSGKHRFRDLKLTGPVTVLVGPEGGFSDAEQNLIAKHNFQGIKLGPRILRTETAGLVALSILQAQFGDL